MRPRWPFVGRSEEMALISRAMADPGISGVLLSGPAGVGKTRLVWESIQATDPRHHLARWLVATPLTRAIPFGALATLLPAELPPAGRPTNLLRQAVDVLTAPAETRRLVLGIDDAHLLDDLSAALVHQLVQSRKGFVLMSLRSGESAPDPVLALWKDELVERVELQALSRTEFDRVLSTALGAQVDNITAQRLWRSTQGNMLFLRELVNAGLDSGALAEIEGVWRWDGDWVLAPRLVELITHRLGQLDAAEQRLLELIAYGEPIGAGPISGLTEAAVWERLTGKNLFWIDRNDRRAEVRLAHPLYGEAIRAACSLLRERQIKRDLADAIAATGMRRKEDLLRVVTWRLDANAPIQPQDLYAAASQAFAKLDFELAERLAKAAFSAGVVEAAQMLWRILLMQERYSESEQILATLTESPMPDVLRTDLTIGRWYNLYFGMDRVAEAREVLFAAKALVRDPACVGELDVYQAVSQAYVGDARPALTMIDNVLGRSVLVPGAAAQAGVVKGVTLMHLGRPGEALSTLAVAEPEISKLGGEHPWVIEAARMTRCHANLVAGSLDAAEAEAIAGYTDALQTGWDLAIICHCITRAQVSRMKGQLGDARQHLREGLALFRKVQSAGRFYGFWLLGELAHVEALMADIVAAQTALSESDTIRRQSQLIYQPWVELARHWTLAATGDRQGAVSLALDTGAKLAAAEVHGFELFALHDVVRFGAAHRVAGRLAVVAEKVGGAFAPLLAAHAAAAAEADATRLDEVAGGLQALGASLLAAEAFAQAEKIWARAGRAASGRRSAARAGLLLDRCQGARTPAVDTVVAPALTAREREIARLAAAGMSAREIADRLVISVRTVDNHLYQVYVKLGVKGRSGLRNLFLPE